jgi:hypothetical protein
MPLKARNSLPSQLLAKLVQRAKQRILIEPNTGCWLWPGSTTKGYGTIGCSIDGKDDIFLIHRLMWMNEHGAIPEGLEPDHLCKTPLCSNPAHLELVTRRVNNLRGKLPSIASELIAKVSDKGAQVNRDKTHCPKGHPYEGYNLIQSLSNGRTCRICKVAWTRQYRARCFYLY